MPGQAASARIASPSSRALRAGILSVGVGIVVMALKFVAWYLTGSTVLLADASESIVNVIAAGLVTYSVMVAARPADEDHPYGHGKAEAISAAIEGAMITVAATVIVIQSIHAILTGPELTQLATGMGIAALTAVANLATGLYLVRVGRNVQSEAIRADGTHLLVDVLTTLGAITALAAVKVTGIKMLDPIVALLVAANIVFTGWRVVRGALTGLLDEADFDLIDRMAEHLESKRMEDWVEIHQLRARRSGSSQLVDLHLMVPRDQSIERAHASADRVERALNEFLGSHGDAVVHIDPCLPSYCHACCMQQCPIRSEPLVQRLPFDRVSLTKPGPL